MKREFSGSLSVDQCFLSVFFDLSGVKELLANSDSVTNIACKLREDT